MLTEVLCKVKYNLSFKRGIYILYKHYVLGNVIPEYLLTKTFKTLILALKKKS